MSSFRLFCMYTSVLACSYSVALERVGAQPSFSEASVLPRGNASVQGDYLRSSAASDSPSWALYTLRNVVGIGRSVELSAGVSYLPGDAIQPLAFTPGAKLQLLSQDRASVSLAIAGAAYVSISRVGTAPVVPWGILFGVVDRSFGETLPSASFGAYSLVGTRSVGESGRGLLAAVGQTITSSFAVNVDWVSGDNYFGSLSPGATLSHGNYALWLGYVRGTNPHGNSGPSLSFAVDR